MKIGVIQASSQISKNALLYDSVVRSAAGNSVINFGCTDADDQRYSYIEIALLAGLLLESGAVDFIVTGCSSGQGMMLALNSMPGVLCGYAPSPEDAYLFAQINDGNAVSLPLGEDYTYRGRENLERTLGKLFSEPFGQGWPKRDAERKKRDTLLLKRLRANSQTDVTAFLEKIDPNLVNKILTKRNVTDCILTDGKDGDVVGWLMNAQKDR